MTNLLRYTMIVPALLLLTIGASSTPAQVIKVVPTQGTCRVIALFAKFPNEDPEQTTPPSYAEDLFDPDLPGSFTHFYNEMSLGKFTVEGTVLPTYYTSHRPASGYRLPKENTEGYFGTFNQEVLENADQDVDFGRFDNDGPDGLPNSGDDDGYVDYLFILVKSKPQGFLPGNATGIARLGLENDFITNDPAPSGYITITSIRGATQRVWNFASAAGIMAHEFGHALGLPDLYDKISEDHEDDSAGIGVWGLMGRGALGWHGHDGEADGPAPFCAWSRKELGWAEVVHITEDAPGQVLTDVATTGIVYRIPLGERGSYYLLENRQSAKSTYDRHIPQDGLLIWHIRSRVSDVGQPNGEEHKKKVDLVCADGLYLDRGYPDGIVAAPDSGRDNLDFWAHDEAYRSHHTGNLGDPSDVFDGVRFMAFTPDTNPRSSRGLSIKRIRRSGTDLIADIRVPRWSGPITEHVTWNGLIHVEGDIVVQEGATLNICAGTVVLFSPTDILQSGTGRDRCEIDVFGTLKSANQGDPVCFTTGGKGTWLGIRLHEETASMWWSIKPEIFVEDCEHALGIFWSEHPDAERPELFRCIVQDNGEEGNGDGALNPGETVGLVLDIRNWTRKPFSVAFSTDDPFVANRRMPPFGAVVPGRTEASVGCFTVASNCPDGHRVSFNIEFKNGAETWTETFSLPVNGLETERSTELITDVGETDPLHSLPCSFALRQNVPNPFNTGTVISFELPRPMDITLTIFNAVGQTIKQWQGYWTAGHHSLTWNGQDEHGTPVASGVYFYRLQAEHFTQTHTATLLR